LGEDAAREFCAVYDVTKAGNFEGRNILHLATAGAETSADDSDKQASRLPSSRVQLFAAREERIKPHRDEKILTAWNGLMMAAFADAGSSLGNKEYLDIARSNAEFILRETCRDGRLLRTWKNGVAKLNGYIEDYCNVADGLIVLYQATGEIGWLVKARGLADTTITEFWDEDTGGFFFTSNDHEELVVRNKDFYDNATPSGNSVGADVLLRLSKLTGDEKYERFAIGILRLAASQVRRHPQGFGRALSAMEFALGATKEIAVIGPLPSDLSRAVAEQYLPHAVVALTDDPQRDAASIPLFDGRDMVDAKPTAFVCENFACQMPVTTVPELLALLDEPPSHQATTDSAM
jgi:hypothetical protein